MAITTKLRCARSASIWKIELHKQVRQGYIFPKSLKKNQPKSQVTENSCNNNGNPSPADGHRDAPRLIQNKEKAQQAETS